ncbi:MAG: hypothetical protein GWM98_28665 [Nitrospinaceae bacterium]|nr:hypothetical protein [Nitrospinaceae bacterium]NIR57702.1 hypothetical protein [Nitrospinaceae bacterium]NIS88166.1 hypothetical protein [Nitrospinaceae bacterium]NIT85044.1 hypothetical protein [Nitrospinaceae bacterium]NIU47206.1 hypothetical protein [Nitrospinaceae bacterium]
MSDDLTNFIPDQLSEEPSETEKAFHLDECVREAQALKEDFVFDLEEQRNQDASNILKAREGVREIFTDAMAKAKEQAKKLQEEAQEKGFREGHEEGYQAGAGEVREEFSASLNAVKNLLEQISSIKQKMYTQLEREMAEMVAGLTRKIIRSELEGRENRIQEIVRLAVESVLDRESLVIKLHPEDHQELEMAGEDLSGLFHEIKDIRYEAHPSVARGNCVVESNFGIVEAGLDHLDETIDKILHLAPPSPLPPTRPDEGQADFSAEPDRMDAQEAEAAEASVAPEEPHATFGEEETVDPNHSIDIELEDAPEPEEEAVDPNHSIDVEPDDTPDLEIEDLIDLESSEAEEPEERKEPGEPDDETPEPSA